MGWQEGVSIPTRMRCGVCRNVMPLGFVVPDEVWEKAVPTYFRQDEVCISCFASFADERMLKWERGIKFFPVSLRTHFDKHIDDGSL